MRRALCKQWPALSQLYGLHPWDLDRLTGDEVGAYLNDLAENAKRANEGR